MLLAAVAVGRGMVAEEDLQRRRDGSIRENGALAWKQQKDNICSSSIHSLAGLTIQLLNWLETYVLTHQISLLINRVLGEMTVRHI